MLKMRILDNKSSIEKYLQAANTKTNIWFMPVTLNLNTVLCKAIPLNRK